MESDLLADLLSELDDITVVEMVTKDGASLSQEQLLGASKDLSQALKPHKEGRDKFDSYFLLRAIPFEKLGAGCPRPDFQTTPTGISKFLGIPTRGIIFLVHLQGELM